LEQTLENIILATVKTEGHSLENPSEYFNPTAQAISNRPAINKINQYIKYFP